MSSDPTAPTAPTAEAEGEMQTDDEKGAIATRALRVLLFADGEPRDFDLLFLGWRGAPPGASFSGRDFASGDVDLGDEDCDDLPSLPTAPGLWLFTWPYEMVPSEWAGHADLDGEATGEVTAKYGPTCTWTRPTMDDLRAFNMFPEPEAAPYA